MDSLAKDIGSVQAVRNSVAAVLAAIQVPDQACVENLGAQQKSGDKVVGLACSGTGSGLFSSTPSKTDASVALFALGLYRKCAAV